MIDPVPGLCATCRHGRTVVSAKGSRFLLCERSRTDPTFPRYPRLPVLACRGYERATAEDAVSADDLDARDGSNLDSADI